jgi:hypothetical protein
MEIFLNILNTEGAGMNESGARGGIMGRIVRVRIVWIKTRILFILKD